MKRHYLLALALLAPCFAQAELHAQFKNFAVGKEGMWKTTTTVVEGPQKGHTTDMSACVDAKQSAAAAGNMMAASSTVTSCKTTVTKDTANEAASEQVCALGGATSTVSTQMKKLSADSYETTMTTTTGGMVMKVKMVSAYTGPCKASAAATPAAPATSPELAKQCTECKTNAADMKAKCKTVSAQEQTMCNAIVPQMEAACAVACK